MASENNGAFIRNIAEVPWREFPNHFGGALFGMLILGERVTAWRVVGCAILIGGVVLLGSARA